MRWKHVEHVHRLWSRHPDTEGNFEYSRKKDTSKFRERKKKKNWIPERALALEMAFDLGKDVF